MYLYDLDTFLAVISHILISSSSSVAIHVQAHFYLYDMSFVSLPFMYTNLLMYIFCKYFIILFTRIRRYSKGDQGSVIDRTKNFHVISWGFSFLSLTEVRSDCCPPVLPPYLSFSQRRILVERYRWTDNKRRKFRVPHSDLYIYIYYVYTIYLYYCTHTYIDIHIVHTYTDTRYACNNYYYKILLWRDRVSVDEESSMYRGI